MTFCSFLFLFTVFKPVCNIFLSPCFSSFFVQDFEGQVACKDCTPGYFCNSESTLPQICPVRFYCPLKSASPTLCPPGTYGNATQLTGADECISCPAGHYCTDSTITDTCTAGFICWKGNPTPSPSGDDSTIGGPCPVGHYCPQGHFCSLSSLHFSCCFVSFLLGLVPVAGSLVALAASNHSAPFPTLFSSRKFLFVYRCRLKSW